MIAGDDSFGTARSCLPLARRLVVAVDGTTGDQWALHALTCFACLLQQSTLCPLALATSLFIAPRRSTERLSCQIRGILRSS